MCCVAAAKGAVVMFASGNRSLAFFFSAGFTFFVEFLSVLEREMAGLYEAFWCQAASLLTIWTALFFEFHLYALVFRFVLLPAVDNV
jgi:hypothetical protein